MEPTQNVPGSFRDPAGRVFLYEGRVHRGVDDASYHLLRELTDTGLLARLIADGLLVGTEFVEDAQLQEVLAAAQPPFRRFLRHRTVPMLSWPYEWTISMLADAALLTLDLQRLAAGGRLRLEGRHRLQRSVRRRPAHAHRPGLDRAARAAGRVVRPGAVLADVHLPPALVPRGGLGPAGVFPCAPRRAGRPASGRRLRPLGLAPP